LSKTQQKTRKSDKLYPKESIYFAYVGTHKDVYGTDRIILQK